MTITLLAQPLTREAFSPYGEVVETRRDTPNAMNAARFERFDNLCNVDLMNDGPVAVSIARCLVPTSLPLTLEMVERHPLGSQAFVPLSPCKMVVVVALAGESVTSASLKAFVSNGRQGINYHRGTWHMPLIAFAEGQEYLVIDRGGSEANCEEHILSDAVLLQAD